MTEKTVTITLTEEQAKVLKYVAVMHSPVFECLEIYLKNYVAQNPHLKEKTKSNIRYIWANCMPKMKELDQTIKEITKQLHDPK